MSISLTYSTNGQCCPNWILSRTSDVHVARDRAWFGDDYIPLRTKVRDLIGGTHQAVGVGSVVIYAKCAPETRPDSPPCKRLVLVNVLHVPDFNFNVLGGHIDQKVMIVLQTQDTHSGYLEDAHGQRLAHFKPLSESANLFDLALYDAPQGPKLGPSRIEKDKTYLIQSCMWSVVDRKRFARFKARRQRRAEKPHRHGEQPLTSEEKAWANRHYGGEFNFLRANGFKMHDEEDRADGWKLLRGFMQDARDAKKTVNERTTARLEDELRNLEGEIMTGLAYTSWSPS